jgi:spermidine synthase
MSTYRPDPDRAVWTALFFGSGAISLVYEMVWMRRVGLLLGGSALAAAVTVGAFMGGLALGGLLSQRLYGRPARTYAALEAGAACWALAFPWLLTLVRPLALQVPETRWGIATLLLATPAVCLGATWPLLARHLPAERAAGLYAVNTVGATTGVLWASFVSMPALGVRTTELLAATAGLLLALAAWRTLPVTADPEERPPGLAPAGALAAALVAGLVATGLEVLWFRLASTALGSTVQLHGVVLAAFLATMAFGAAVGRTWPVDPRRGVIGGLTALGVLAALGATAWSHLPFAVAALYRWGGPEAMLPGSALLAVVLMGGAPAASGLAFSATARALGDRLEATAGSLYATNALGCLIGAWCVGLWWLPELEARGTVLLLATLAGLGASVIGRHPLPLVLVGASLVLVPAWDARLYAVGLHLRVSDFADPSDAALRRFVDEGWVLERYDHGPTAAVAVGRSTRTGNVWLSINGKVDASTGDDMPTQQLSGILPVRMTAEPREVLLVGLASGVTAGAVLAEPGVERLTVVELEPAVVDASHHFDHVNGRPLDDPRTTLILDDARAVLDRGGPLYDVIISEPSNPWITGVSNLFTREYWLATRQRLAPDGVMCQWVQLYGMGPDELRALVRTFQSVYPEVWLFETVPGADALLIGGAPERDVALPIAPTLDPAGVGRLAGHGWLNTDDHPRVEWRGPGWLHYATAPRNAEIIAEAASPDDRPSP